MSGPRAPKPSPLVGEGAERQAVELAQPARPRREAGEGTFAKVGKNPSPGRSPSGGALRRPDVSRPPSPTRGEGTEPVAADTFPSTPTVRARALRSRMTDAERKLWFALRDRRFASFKFRRQVPIGPYIADFICYELRVVIEADGGQHSDSRSDQRRNDRFARNDFLVMRFWNNDVLSNREGVLTCILEALNGRRKHGAKGRMS
jgi:very-short-patch-repair endonuclease